MYLHHMELHQDTCIPCEGGIPPLSRGKAEAYLTQVPQWAISTDGLSISRHFTFTDFKQAMKFINAVATVAEQQGHHPDIFCSWNTVILTLSTHAISGLSYNDFVLAAKVDRAV